jgi:predicted transcriptional regulator
MALTIELDEQTAATVEELAADQKRFASEVIRDALAVYTGKRKRRLPKRAGKHSSGHTDTAQKVDEILTEAVKEGRWP